MKILRKNLYHMAMCIFLCFLIFLSNLQGIALASTGCLSGDSKPDLLNDRAADIIASSPLLMPGLLNPLGLSGKGQIIGIADSGLDKGSMSDIHPDLQSEAGKMPKVAILKSYSGRTLPDDPIGHGTHMAATIAGTGQASEGKYRGIAPGANLYFQALLDQEDRLLLPQKLSELFAPAYSAGVRVHVNGWGGSGNSYAGNSAQIDDFVFKNPEFLPVFGAGNSGPARASITAEANSKNALTVGFSQLPRPAFSPEACYADQIAVSSSRGPAQDGRIKPELLAPGTVVISACSSLTTGNFAANSRYTQMSGSSMAAAVTGGALAILSEYLESQKAINNPSSALLKALLINGASTPENFPSKEMGFGILNLAGSILALEEGMFSLVDNSPIQMGQSQKFAFRVEKQNAPFKASLTWVEPAAQAGSVHTLVNNLDLLVQDPSGRIFRGNDFLQQGQADSINNIEQIVIPKPLPGEYTIEVRGSELDPASGSQNFALVYGQSLQHEIIKSAETDGTIKLAGGGQIKLSSLKLKGINSDIKSQSPENIQPGSDLYISPQSAYIFSESWQSSGVQLLPWQDGTLSLEINPQIREGGFFLDPRMDAGNGGIFFNDLAVDEASRIPVGVAVNAAVNPGMQNIWHIKSYYQEIKGIIEGMDLDKHEMRLLRDSNTYSIASSAAISFKDELLDCTDVAAPFGSAQTATLDMLAPGMKVSLIMSPGQPEVQYIKVERQIVMGLIESIDEQQGKVIMNSGRSYQLFPGALVHKDNLAAELGGLVPGDSATALLLPDSDFIIQLKAFSNVVYGQAVYYNRQSNDLYLLDHNNSFKRLLLNSECQIFQGGLEVEQASILPGKWLRLICSPEQEEVWRVDIAQALEDSSGVFAAYNPEKRSITLEDGSGYSIGEFTQVIKGGYLISPELVLPGEKLQTTKLTAPYPRSSFVARVKVETNPGAVSPELQVKAYSLNGILIIQGQSSADRVFLYCNNKMKSEIPRNADGSFNRIFPLEDDESELRVLVMDSINGGIKSIDLKITAYPTQQSLAVFNDIAGHPAQEQITRLCQRGIISGYDDQSFRPGQMISRAEFVTMLARALGWELEGSEDPQYFSDSRDIPWWALAAVYSAQEKGILNGYHDGTLKPQQAVSRSEMAVMLSRLLKIEESKSLPGNKLPYLDRDAIPQWALASFMQVHNAGLLLFNDDTNLNPMFYLTRGEAAMIVDRLLS